MSVFAVKPLGTLALAGLLTLSLFNLHGCGQFYRDSTQHQWLVNFQKRTVAKAPLVDNIAPGSGHASTASLAFNGAVNTRLSGRLSDPQLSELSGLAPSLSGGALWAINDSGNPSTLYSISQSGQVLARHALPVRNRDWESLDRFDYDGQSWLLVADTGDNLARRKFSVLYLVPEPPAGSQKPVGDIREVRISYESGPQNIESVAVSEKDDAVYFIAKKANAPMLFALSLKEVMTATSPLVALQVGHMHSLYFNGDDNVIERMVAGHFLLGPTAFDISDDDRFAVVANYRHVYLFRKNRSESWVSALARKPEIIAGHRLAQSESVAFGQPATVIVGSEGMQAPLLLIDGNSPSAE